MPPLRVSGRTCVGGTIGIPGADGRGVWHPSAPRSPRLAARNQNGSAGWEDWKDYLLSHSRELFSSGEWDLDVRRDGQPAKPRSSWEELISLSDRDVDYLELELRLSAGLKVQRHILLAHNDRFLFLADAVLGRQPGRLDYCGRLPLGPGIEFQPAGEGREGFVVGPRGKRRALVIPLALPLRRSDRSGGSLSRTDRGLELRQSARGRALLAPLWLDLNPRRISRPLTWRQLTVAEHSAIQPPDVAAGYRVKVGKEQWLVYRALTSRGNRTLLGHNLITETLVARFHADGQVEPLVEIQ